MSSNQHFTSFFTGNGRKWRKLTQNVDFSSQTGFTYGTAVRWPMIIFSWHRYQFNCNKPLRLNHFSKRDYHDYFWIYHCLNSVDIFLFFFIRNGHLLAEISLFWIGAKYDYKTIVLYIKQNPKELATIYKKTACRYSN